MRLMKAQNTNLRNIYGKGVKYDINGQVIIDSTNTMLVPKGTEAQRPSSPVNGHLRYNTDDDQFEAYQNGAWRELRFKEPNQDPGIVVQSLGVGDASETDFGPLDSQDTDFPIPAAEQNVLVFVENVYQLPTTNYTLKQNPSGKAAGWYIRFGSAPPSLTAITISLPILVNALAIADQRFFLRAFLNSKALPIVNYNLDLKIKNFIKKLYLNFNGN